MFYSISYKNGKKYMTVEISKFIRIKEMNNRTLKPSQIQKHTRLKTYNASALPNLLYGFRTWAIREEDKCRIK